MYGWLASQIRYALYVLRHKWYVFIECCKVGMPLTGFLHDLSKLRPSEWFPYARYFYPSGRKEQFRGKAGYYKPTDTGDAAFDFAWLLHQKRNRHHWQWWTSCECAASVLSSGRRKESRRCKRSSASDAESRDPLKNSRPIEQASVGPQEDSSVPSTGKSTAESSVRSTDKSSKSTTGPDTPQTRRRHEPERGSQDNGEDSSVCNTTEGSPQAVLAAGKNTLSSSALTTPVEVGPNTERRSEEADTPCTDGSSKTTSHQSSGFSAITATPPLGTTGNALTETCEHCKGSGFKVFPMSRHARLEMLCDWRGAGKAQGYASDDVPTWYIENEAKMQLHVETRRWVEKQLGVSEGALVV